MDILIESAKKWIIERPDESVVQNLTEQLQISTVHAKILVARGITNIEEAKKFLHMDESAVHDPFLLHDMEKAVSIIRQTIENDELIAIYGDYDADGVTGTSLLQTVFQQLGAEPVVVIPNRFKHGYGPNRELFQELYEQGVSLIITVDNGVSGVEEIAFAKSLGLQVIITDHHEAGAVWPEADATIHPKHPDGNYPFQDLAGVGVAFKLASALLETIPFELLEFVAIGTIADLVPLRGENRYFVKRGIEQLRQTKRLGLQELLQVSGVEARDANEESIGFSIGPRLNAVGRLGDAYPAVDLLMATDLASAKSLAEQLDTLNKERQAIVSTIAADAEQLIAAMYGDDIPAILVLEKEGWNPGVVGIVASRLTDKYYRPTILLSIDKETGMAKGSARSIDGFNLYEQLTIQQAILPHYGGHPMAAGLSVAIDDIAILREQLTIQAEQTLSAEQLIPKLHIDVPLTLGEIDIATLEQMDDLRPFGMSFPKPTYLIEHVKPATVRKIGAAKNHLKMDVTDDSTNLDVIGFGFGEMADEISPGIQLSLVGDLQINEWNGNKKPQILVRDLCCEEWQLFDLRGIREVTRWIQTIPEKNTRFLAFQEQTIVELQPFIKNATIQLYNETEIIDCKNLVFVDMPYQVEQIEQVMRDVQPSRVYAHFHVSNSTYFDVLPNREQFGWYYSFLKSRGQFDLLTNGPKLAAHKGWQIGTVNFMSEVFLQLGFVRIESGLISFVETTDKRALHEAPIYQKREQQMELEKKLLYAPYMELKKWLETIRVSDVVEEEVIR